jgi:hypothetical protein
MLSDGSFGASGNPQQKQVARPRFPNVPDEEIEYDEASFSDAVQIKPDLMLASEAVDDQELVDAIFDAKLITDSKKQKWISKLKLVAILVGGLTPPIASAVKDGAGLLSYVGSDFFADLGRWIQRFPALAPFLMHSSGAAIHSALNESTYAVILQIKKDIEAIRNSIYSKDMSGTQNKRANALYGDQSTRKDKAKLIDIPKLPSRKHRLSNHLPTLVAVLLTALMQGLSGGNEAWSLAEGDEDYHAIWRLIKSGINLLQTFVTLLFLTGLSEKITSKAITPLSKIKKDFSEAFIKAQKVRFTLLLTQVGKHEKNALKKATVGAKNLQTENLKLKREYDASKLQTTSKQKEVEKLYAEKIIQKKVEQDLRRKLVSLTSRNKGLSSNLSKQQNKILELTEQLDETTKRSSQTDFFQLKPEEPQPNKDNDNVLSN